jgi:lysophospholipase L1-like esterase
MSESRFVPSRAAAYLALSLASAVALSVPAAAQSPVAAAPACGGPADLFRFDDPLERVVGLVAKGQPLKIVTIGSSSTAGAGASSPALNYPNRLQAELRARLPGIPVTVVNRGVNGEVATDMMKRFAADVFAEKPDLIIWQVGTNSVLRDQNVLMHAPVIRDGIEELLATGADVVVMNSQFAPKVLEKSDIYRMVDIVGAEAKDAGAQLFDRFALMRHWHDQQNIAIETFVHPDGLHLNDWSYGCVAKVLAAAILDGAKPPVATARAVPQPPRVTATPAAAR